MAVYASAYSSPPTVLYYKGLLKLLSHPMEGWLQRQIGGRHRMTLRAKVQRYLYTRQHGMTWRVAR